jgi:hypothetical protein
VQADRPEQVERLEQFNNNDDDNNQEGPLEPTAGRNQA